ncbi:MAG: type II toxin-antitoxin system PemK/MazF family toxin [Phycisphaerales bacterium]|nr:type II toxin-antitoxin system PemK/MazF family toxin [Phycisphaerales bacterium]
MPFQQRDLLLLPVPFSDLTARKIRPVVVLSNDHYNRSDADILVAGVTSNLAPRPFTVEMDSGDLEYGTLKLRSAVRVDKIFSIDQRIVLKQFARANKELFMRIRQQIDALIAEVS